MTLTLEIDDRIAGLLAVLDEDGDVAGVVRKLIDHAQQGVYRPGAWERHWLKAVFYEDWEAKLEPGDPYGRRDCDKFFQRPRKPHAT
jgi:hypothetical protein